MTVVIAKCFGQTISVLSDTMISDANLGRQNAIPGRLKSIVLDRSVTVAYAGHSDPALYAIRQARALLKTGDLSSVVEFLRQVSSNGDADIDFLLVAHAPHADLRRIWKGRVSDPLRESCIGNAAILPEVMKSFSSAGDERTDAHSFRSAFLDAFTNRRIHLGAGVGGFPISLEARAEGHVYKGHGFGESWKPIYFVPGQTTHETEEDMLTGEWSFHHHVLSSDRPGVAVIAAEVPQAKVGFVYAPLLEDDPQTVVLLANDKSWVRHQKEIHDALRQALNEKIAASQETEKH
jgi:hypothetical protein